VADCLHKNTISKNRGKSESLLGTVLTLPATWISEGNVLIQQNRHLQGKFDPNISLSDSSGVGSH
jgi:hypothetical protein